MGKHKPFILLGVAIIIALITSLLIYKFLETRGKVKDVTLETQAITVAVTDLTWGTVLTKEVLKTEPFLKSSLPGGSFPDSSALIGRVLISNVKAKEPILESRLAPITVKTGGVAAVVSHKKRAVAVKVDKVIGVSGFVHPGNRVDVLTTISTSKTSEPVTKTVLENILVLAAGPEIETKGKEEKPATVDVITLEVTPEEAEKLALSASEGKLQLALRNFNDTEDVLTKGTTIPTLLASYSGVGVVKEVRASTGKAVRSKRPVPDQPRAITVELIRGNKLTEMKLEGRE